jgi:hypothetical protein
VYIIYTTFIPIEVMPLKLFFIHVHPATPHTFWQVHSDAEKGVAGFVTVAF